MKTTIKAAALIAAAIFLLTLQSHPRLQTFAQVTSNIPSYKGTAAGSVSRTVNDRLTQVVYVKDYGCRGDGTTDDTANFIKARDAAGVRGQVIFDKGGTYIISQADVLDWQTIEIPKGAIVMRKANVVGAHSVLFRVLDKTGVTFCGGGVIDGNTAETMTTGYSGIWLHGGTGHTVENLTIQNFPTDDAGAGQDGDAVNVGAGAGGSTPTDILIRGNRFIDNERNGMQVGACDGLTIVDNFMSGSATGEGCGIDLEKEAAIPRLRNVKIANNHFRDNKIGVAISYQVSPPDYTKFDNFQIIGNTFDTTTTNAIQVNALRKGSAVIANNIISDSGGVGIYVTNSRDVTVTGNQVFDSGTFGFQANQVKRYIVTDNHFIRSGDHGMTVTSMSAGVNYGQFAYNQVWNSGQGGGGNSYGLNINEADPANNLEISASFNYFGNDVELGTATQKYGIWCGAGGDDHHDNVELAFNHYVANTTAPYIVKAGQVVFESTYNSAIGRTDIRMDRGGLEAASATVASSASLSLSGGGNTFTISGSTQIEGITTAGWQAGSQVSLVFSGTATVVNNSSSNGAGTGKVLLNGTANWVPTSTVNRRLILTFDGTNWYGG